MTKPFGLHCVECGKRMLRTYDSRPAKDAVRRIKECVCCGTRVTTIETIVGKTRRRKTKGAMEHA